MSRFSLSEAIGVALLAMASVTAAMAQPGAGPYKILKTAKVGGAGGFDYVYAVQDSEERVESIQSYFARKTDRYRYHKDRCDLG